MSQEQLQQAIIEWIQANKRTSNHVEISADTELLGTGILDSFSFLDLIMHIESKRDSRSIWRKRTPASLPWYAASVTSP